MDDLCASPAPSPIAVCAGSDPAETGLAARCAALKAALKGADIAALARVSGVPETTLRDMRRPDWKPRPIANLEAVERGLATLAGGEAAARDHGAEPSGAASS